MASQSGCSTKDATSCYCGEGHGGCCELTLLRILRVLLTRRQLSSGPCGELWRKLLSYGSGFRFCAPFLTPVVPAPSQRFASSTLHTRHHAALYSSHIHI